MRFPRLCQIACTALLLPLVLLAEPATEFDVKAAFLFNFTKFVEWPPSAFAAPDSPMNICVVGRDPFGRALDEIVQGERVGGRRVAVERLSAMPPPKTCQLVYIDAEGKEVSKLLASAGPGVLTVGEGDDFLRDGGIIGFVIENHRVRFDINQAAAENAALKLSSKLLSVARFVEHRPPG